MTQRFIPPHGGYEQLLSFQKARIVYDGTVWFCKHYLDKRDRTYDQMVQAARSGKQNILEGSQASGTSKATEIKLTNVARASLEELLEDYRDYYRKLLELDREQASAFATRYCDEHGLQATFKELFSGTFSGEIGQLTAQAIRSMQEARESDALASLQRAETLLDTLNAEALPLSRREEVDRRLWWGYNKLGTRRVEAGQHEDALEPLFHALGYDVGPTRRQETVALLVRALDGVADARALAVRELADGGDREAALVQCDKLWALLRGATNMGLAQSDLTATFGKVQRLFESLGRSRP